MSSHLMTSEHFARIEQSENFHALREVAEDILKQMAAPISMVCGPISTGGFGDISLNMERFRLAISTLEALGHNIFNQIPFEPRIGAIHFPGEDGYDWNILNHFYKPLFVSGFITRKFFIPNWETSVGARWEREQAALLGIEVVNLADDLSPLW